MRELKVHLVKEDTEPVKKTRWQKVLAFLFAGTIGGFVVFSTGLADLGLDFFKAKLIEQEQKRNKEIALSTLSSQIITANSISERSLLLETMIEVGTLERVLELEPNFRSVATVAVLEKHGKESEHKDIIDRHLGNTPKVAFVDAVGMEYCDHSRDTGRTNIDDIFPLISHLPVRTVSYKWLKRELKDSPNVKISELKSQIVNLAEEIEDQAFDVLVIHNSTFEYDGSADGFGLVDFLREIGVPENQKLRVVLYSRDDGAKTTKRQLTKGTKPKGMSIEPLRLVLKDDCFDYNSTNGARLVQAMSRALSLDSKYYEVNER